MTIQTARVEGIRRRSFFFNEADEDVQQRFSAELKPLAGNRAFALAMKAIESTASSACSDFA
jgi:hypothetical protein